MGEMSHGKFTSGIWKCILNNILSPVNLSTCLRKHKALSND